MKQQQEMVLFGSTVPLARDVAKCVLVKPRFVYHKHKVGKKMVVERDEANNPVLELNPQGEPIVSSTRIALLPRTSKEGANLKDATGLVGQGLFAFERTVRDGLCDAALAEAHRLRATGQYTFGSQVRNERTGAITLTLKPVFGGKSVVASPDEDLQKEMERRGYQVTKAPAKGDGEQTDATPETKPVTKKGKKS